MYLKYLKISRCSICKKGNIALKEPMEDPYGTSKLINKFCIKCGYTEYKED